MILLNDKYKCELIMNQNLKPNISVIMPVYNVKEEYLKQAIDSVLNQLYTDFELIIINDCSTNNSEEVILSYTDKRIKYLANQERRGQSNARNIALKIAKGKYIIFIDADDWIHVNAFKKLIKKAEKQDFDILCFGTYIYNNESQEQDIWLKDDDVSLFPDENTCFNPGDSILTDNLFHISNACWGKLFKKDFLINNNLFFVENLIFEDMEFFVRSMLNAGKIAAVKDYFYYYRSNVENSTMSSSDERYFDAFKILDLIENVLVKNNMFEKLKMPFYYYKFNFLMFAYEKIGIQF